MKKDKIEQIIGAIVLLPEVVYLASYFYFSKRGGA